MIDSVATFVAALRESRLLPPERLQEVIGDFQARFPEPRALARQLMRLDWLTPYQINQLFQGRSQHLVLGPYRLLERLGEGGMGQVFKARHMGLDRVVALKVMRKEHMDDPDSVHRFHREIRAAAQLSHPNIVMAYDADEVDGTHFFVMEYVAGIDLGRLVQQSGPLAVEQACDYIRQAALGLQHALERGLVHRDIKPSNLLLAHPPRQGVMVQDGGSGPGTSRAPVVKILDLGLARLPKRGEIEESGCYLTQEGRVIGTPDFMAPEQAINSHKTDIRADLYSLGCTFYYLLTGHVLFRGGTPIEKLIRHRLDPPPPIERARPGVSADIRAILYKLLAKRPKHRFQTPAQLAAALAAALKSPVAAPSPRGTADLAEPTPADVLDFTAATMPVAAAVPVPWVRKASTDPAEARPASAPPPNASGIAMRRKWRRSTWRSVRRVALALCGLLMLATLGLFAVWLLK
jgi:serine/threonine protein kinase